MYCGFTIQRDIIDGKFRIYFNTFLPNIDTKIPCFINQFELAL